MEKSAIRLERGGYLKIAAPILIPALPDRTESAAQPGISQRAVDCHRILKRAFGLSNFVLRAEQKPKQRVRGRVTRREVYSFFQGRFRLRHTAKAEMQFRQARPGKAEFRIDLCRVLRRF